MFLQIRRFFEDYKVLEHKQVVVEDLLGRHDAVRIIREALDLYRQLRRGELAKSLRPVNQPPSLNRPSTGRSRTALEPKALEP